MYPYFAQEEGENMETGEYSHFYNPLFRTSHTCFTLFPMYRTDSFPLQKGNPKSHLVPGSTSKCRDTTWVIGSLLHET